MQTDERGRNSIRLFCEVAREVIFIDALPAAARLSRLQRLADNLEFIVRVIPEIGDTRFVEELRYVGTAMENLQASAAC